MRENTGPAVAIAGILTMGYIVWGSVLAILLWISMTVYAVVQWIGHDEHADPTVVLLMLIANVTLFLLLLTASVYLVGRSMHYKKGGRRRKDADADLALPADAAEPA